MEQIPISDPEKVLEYLDNLNVDKEIAEYFSEKDKNNIGSINADNYKNIFNNLNKKLGLKMVMGKKEWDWVLNLIKKKSGDTLNKKEAKDIYNHMIIISRDYLCSLPNSNNNLNDNSQNSFSKEIKTMKIDFLKLVKEHKFEGDSINGKSINTIIDLNNNYFLATIGERGKILFNKNNYEVISYKKDHGFYVTCKVNSFLISAINTDNEGTLWYSDFELNNLIQYEIKKSEMHNGWISKIVQISDNIIATSSGDNTIKIWELINEKKIKLIKTLNKHKSGVISIIKIKNKNWLVSVSYDNKLIIWDLKKYSVIKEINDIQCCFINGIKELPKQRIIISGDKIMTLINYQTGKIIKIFETGVKGTCFEIINDLELLCGSFNGNYMIINIKDFDIRILKEKEINFISCMMKLDKSLVVGLHNGIMKIYNLLN